MDTLERAELPGPDPESRTEEKVDVGLFSYGGPFDLYPGPVLVLGPSAMVLAANAVAQPIVEMLRRGHTPALEDALAAALSGRVAQINPFLVPARPRENAETGPDSGEPQTSPGATGFSAYDLLVLPWASKLAVLMLGREITLDRSLRTALVDSRQRFKDLVEISSDLAWETDRDGRFTFVSAGEALGHQTEDIIGQEAASFLVVETEAESNPFANRDPVSAAQVWFRRADESAACLAVTAVPLRGPDGSWSGARGLCRDVTAEQARDAELSAARAREQLLAYVLRNVRDETDPRDAIASILAILERGFALEGVVLFEGDGEQSFTEIGQRGQDLPEQPVSDGLRALQEEQGGAHPSTHRADPQDPRLLLLATRHRDEFNGALALYRADRQRAWAQSEIALLEEIALHLGATISQLSRQEALKKLSDSDPLTGLPNRRGFLKGLEAAQRRCIDEKTTSALFFVDLDNFKQVNDRLGHQAGDDLLKDLAGQLQRLVRDRDLVARLGGDEFGLVLQDVTSAQAKHRAREMVAVGEALRAGLPDPGIELGLSIGIAMLDPDQPLDNAALMAKADQAMYDAKRQGKATVVMTQSAAASGAA